MLNVQVIDTPWADGLPGGITVYIIGQPKTGKTTQAAQWSSKGFEGVIVLDTDHGAQFVKNARVLNISSLNPPTKPKKTSKGEVIYNKDGTPIMEIVPSIERGYYYPSGPNKGKPMESYSLAEAYSWLNKEWPNLPYETIVIDTIDEVNKWIENVVLNELDIDAMGQGSWGSDWGLARRKNLDIISKFKKMITKYGSTLIIISHSKSSNVIDTKVQLAPDLPRGLGYALAAKAELIGLTYFDKTSDEPFISFKAYDERVVGSRLAPLAQKILPFNYKAIMKEIKEYKENE